MEVPVTLRVPPTLVLPEAAATLNLFVATDTSPLKLAPVKAAFAPILVVTVVEKLASFPKATANSFNVSNAAGAVLTKLETAFATKAVEAAIFVLSPAV